MKKIKNNTFYKQIPITNATAVKPNYSDLALGGAEDLVTLAGAPDYTLYLLSGSVPSTPAYGESTLIGGTLQMYCSGVTITTSPTIPSLSLYRLKQGTTIAEGTLQPSYSAASGSPVTGSSIGGAISVYRAAAGRDNLYMEENFDGGNKSLGEVKMIRSMGNATIEFSRAYLSIDDAVKKANNLGNASGHKKDVGIKYFVNDDGVVPIKIDGKVSNPWKTKVDKRDNYQRATWKRPYFKWNSIKNRLQFDTPAAAASTPDMEPLASAGNTIFDEVYATADVNNPFTSSETNPLMMTSCELSTAKKYNGAQAFRMYHLWDYSTESAYIQKMIGSKAIIPTTTRASIYNIPRPPLGLDVQRQSLQSTKGYMAGTTPEISLKMNIAKLGFTPYLAYDAQTTKTAAKKTQVSNWAGASTIATSNATYFPGGAGSAVITSTLRSVAVTFSNYKPKTDHTTLDKFLRYGLQRFYEGENSEHIVGGVIFMKTGIDGPANSDPGVLSATAIPVTNVLGGGNTGALPTTGILANTGLMRFDITSGDLENTELLGSNYWQAQYNQDNAAPTTAGGCRNVSIPLDSWFDMKIAIDPGATNSVASTCFNLYGTDASVSDTYAELGVPMRAYFDITSTASGSTDADEDTDKPYLDIYFPAWETGGFTYDKYNFIDQPETYPQHMTIWVQNYRWIQASSDLGYATSDAMFQFGDNGAIGATNGPLPSGAAIEAELFIDDITLKNFTPRSENCSSSNSVTSQRSLQFGSDSVETPFTTYVSGTALHSLRAWAASGSSTKNILNEIDTTEFIIFGYDTPKIWPTGNYTSTASGYMLANGFNTFQYDNLERTTDVVALPDYLMGAFVSTSGSSSYTNSKYLGGQLYGNHYWQSSSNQSQTASLQSSTITLTGDHTSSTKGGACNGLVNLMSGAATLPSQDAFTSKGLMSFAIDGAFDTTSGWTKRENILASTKIIGYKGYDGPGVEIESTYALKVEDPSIFNKYLNEEYVIFRMGSAVPTANTGSAATLGWGVQASTVNKSTKIFINKDVDIEDNIVQFHVVMGDAGGNIEGRPIAQDDVADDGTTKLFTEKNLIDLYISPKKYWLNLYQPANKTPRTYQNFVVVQNVEAAGTANAAMTSSALLGTTWNESTYSYNSSAAANTGQNGVSTNLWDLSTDEDSSLILNKDYGFGSYDEETGKGGELSRQSPIPGQYFDMDISPLASEKDINPEDGLVFMLRLGDNTSKNTLNIVSDDYGSAGDLLRPYLLWEYRDELPKIKGPLMVAPTYKILSGSGADKVDLYNLTREELNALTFTWEEEGDDVLYRLLYVDTAPILDKYDGTYFWAPLNEVPGNSSKIKGYYYSGSTTVGTEFSNSAGSVRDITGPCGWAFDGNAEKSVGANYPYTAGSVAWGWHGKTEGTFIAHGVPNATGTNTSGSLFNDYDNNYGSFDIWYSKAASANANVTPKVTLVSGATTFSGKTYTLTSDYSFVNDGESPLFVVVTFDSTLAYDRIKMYVNGFLAASSKGDWVQDRTLYDGTGYTGQINIGQGHAGVTSRFHGLMSECMVHSRCLYVPTQANQYVMSTASLPDMSGKTGSDTEVKYNARLFLFDYHNIIGSSTDRVASSTEVTWEATGI